MAEVDDVTSTTKRPTATTPPLIADEDDVPTTTRPKSTATTKSVTAPLVADETLSAAAPAGTGLVDSCVGDFTIAEGSPCRNAAAANLGMLLAGVGVFVLLLMFAVYRYRKRGNKAKNDFEGLKTMAALK